MSAPVPEGCHAARDGDCYWAECPQLRDGEPVATGRHCPLDDAFRPVQEGTGTPKPGVYSTDADGSQLVVPAEPTGTPKPCRIGGKGLCVAHPPGLCPDEPTGTPEPPLEVGAVDGCAPVTRSWLMGEPTETPDEYLQGAADERERIAWWIEQGVAGPAGRNLSASEADLLTDLASVIREHPDRFADAPTSQSRSRDAQARQGTMTGPEPG